MNNRTIQSLRERWINQENRITDIIEAIKENKDWTIYLIKHKDNPHGPMPYLYYGNLIKKEDPNIKGPRDLRGINLENVNFSNSKVLSETSFDYAILKEIKFTNCFLNSVCFKNAFLSEIVFEKAAMNHCDFERAKLEKLSFAGANLNHSNFKNCNIAKCVFVRSTTEKITYNEEPSLGHLYRIFGLKIGTHIRKIGGKVDKEENEFCLFLHEQKRIDRIHRSGRFFAFIYYLLANYGRSFRRLGFSILVMWFLFGFIYAGYPVPTVISHCKTCSILLTSLSPEIIWEKGHERPETWFSPYYFSITASTTLTFGDIKPKCWIAKIYVCLQVLFSCVFLGVFVSMIPAYEGRIK